MHKATELRYGTPEEAGMIPERIERVKKLASGWVKEGQTPSLVVLAARKGIIFLHEAYGVLTPDEDSSPLQKDTIFPISSMSKPITATATMILVEDGLLGLNRPVIDYIPEITGEGTEEILVTHLLSHTSGYNDDNLREFLIKNKGTWPPLPPCDETQHPLIHELLNRQYSAPLWKSPGEVMVYSGHNYFLLGEIIRRISGQSLASFANERIFDPLGMVDTTYIVPESHDSRIVKRASNVPFAQPISRYFEGLNSKQAQETPYASRGVYSTTLDMAIFGQMFLNGGTYGDTHILSRPAVTEMIRDQIPGIEAYFHGTYRPNASYGYGWYVAGDTKWKYHGGDLHSQKIFGHGGAGGTSLFVDQKHEIVLTYFSVVLEVTPRFEHKMNYDLFENLIFASIIDLFNI